jgi:hypothetical protein
MPYRATLTYTVCSLLLALCCNPSPAAAKPAPSPANPADSAYRFWSISPTSVYGIVPLDKPKNRPYIRISHSSPDLTVIQDINPAGIVTNTTRVYSKNGLLHLSTATDRWGDSYDSVWYQPDGLGKLLVTERKRGVNPFLPCKYVEYIFRNDVLTDKICYLDSVRAGADQDQVAHYVYERYDDPARRGLIRSETFLSEIDAPAVSKIQGFHKRVSDYDAKGNLLSHSVYDLNDKPVLDRFGIYQAKYKYDNDGNQTDVEYYDTKGGLAFTALGYIEKISEYKHGLLSTETYYLDHLTITRTSRLGDSVSIVWHRNDDAGNPTETEYFDPQTQPTVNAEGLHKVRNEYSPSGMLIRIDAIGLNKESGWDSKINAETLYYRDDKGRIIGRRFKSNTGMNIPDPEFGAYLTRMTYDAWGRISTLSCWQDDSTRTACGLGFYQAIRSYNSDGQLIEVDLADEDGNPTLGTIGYSKELIRYNELGLQSERAYFAGDTPVVLNDRRASMSGFHRLQYGYDAFGRLRTISFFNATGQPVNADLRSANPRKEWKASTIELDYNVTLVTGESFRDSADVHPPVVLNCTKGDCLPLTAFETISRVLTPGATARAKQYHGSFQPDTLFDNQLGFVGQDTVLTFLTTSSGAQTGMTCADRYRLTPIDKFYLPDGRVIDYYMDNDSVAATYSFNHGHLEGPVYLFYKNGQVHEHGTYRNDVKYGSWEYYYDNGQKERTLQYDENGFPLVVNCYKKNGDALAQGGNGQFEGKVAFGAGEYVSEVTAKGNLRNGVPDGEWDLFDGKRDGPSNIEYFSGGKFRHGVSWSLLGKDTYSDKWFTRLDGPHPYEVMDHYNQSALCRPAGSDPFYPEMYAELLKGFTDIIKSGTHSSYSGWIFFDLRLDGFGHVLSSTVRLHQQDEGFAEAIRGMTARLVYPLTHPRPDQSPYDKFYIVLVDGNQVVIPEELVRSHRLDR